MAEMSCLSPFLGSLSLFFMTLDIQLAGILGSNSEVDKHLELGKKMLAAGQLADALSHYHAAVEGDPTNYLTYYRRATVYLALGKSKSAIPDLNKVVELKPDFVAARVQRGNVKLKQGKLQEAEEDYREVLIREPSNTDVMHKLEVLVPLSADIQEAKIMFNSNHFQPAIELLTKAIEVCPWDPDLRDIRAECYMAQGDYFKATGDVRSTTKLRTDNTASYYKLSQLYYQMGEASESLIQIRECLKLDPDHKECFPFYKKVKKLVKQIDATQEYQSQQMWEDCVNKANAMLKTEPDMYTYVQRARGYICHCEAKASNIDAAFKACKEVLEMDENNIEAICDLADTYLANDQFDEAISEFQKAQNIDQNNQRAREGVDRAQKLLKQSQKRDYYKILGVKRNARKKEILKAYRGLAMKWHPDKFEDEEEKKKAAKKFMDIAAAKEVLSDPEKRQKFDQGEDPLDPESQQGQGFNPFGQGFNPFGQQGFQFKFHFN